MLQKIKIFIGSHKIILGLVVVLLIIGAYFLFRNKATGETRYVTEVVERGNVLITVTGTGQVEASNTIDLKPKNTGDITYVGVKAGEVVGKGRLIASVDSRDAKMALENAKISLAKLTKDPDTLTLLQKENALKETYDNGWNTTSSYINEMNLLIDNLEEIYSTNGYLGYNNTIGLSRMGKDKISTGEKSYYDSVDSLKLVNNLYKTLSRSSSKEEIENLIDKSYESSKIIANAIKNTETAFNYVVNDLEYEEDSNTTTTRTDISSWLNDSNDYVNSLLSSLNNIKEGKQSLSDTIAGSDELDIRSAELSLQSKQDAYNDCFIYAPFGGVVATLTAKVGESSGSSVGTLITKQKLATISLNEVDIAKIKLGQKVDLTFDAIDDLTITGEVAEIDSIGAVSQGVVTYNIKISFDLDDDRIKPGMSVSATIITNNADSVIAISSSAIKNQRGENYVEIFDSPLPRTISKTQGSTSLTLPKQVKVEVGLVGDTDTEIISGLKERDIVVTKTITGTTTTTQPTTPSLLNAVGGRGAGGGLRN